MSLINDVRRSTPDRLLYTRSEIRRRAGGPGAALSLAGTAAGAVIGGRQIAADARISYALGDRLMATAGTNGTLAAVRAGTSYV